MHLPILIKFDKRSPVIDRKHWYIPHYINENKQIGKEVLIKTVYEWMAYDFMQEWFEGCKIIWIEGIGEVEMLMEDFV